MPFQRKRWGQRKSNGNSLSPESKGLIYLQWCQLHELAVQYLYILEDGSTILAPLSSHQQEDPVAACEEGEDENECDSANSQREDVEALKKSIVEYYFSSYCETTWFGKLN